HDSMQDLCNIRLEHFTSNSPAMQKALKLARAGAQSDLPMLILGESGTGKTLLAQAIHNGSKRRGQAFISFNASAMTETLLESQLFGHEKGAFTGATQSMPGKFELADKGTLFFDEIADMSPSAQAKILRAVEYGEYERIGSGHVRKADVRIISATNKPLRKLVEAQQFRQDLYFRLRVITITLPALRDRREDLPQLIASEIKNCSIQQQKHITAIHPEAFEKLLNYPWPGNLRELHNTIQTMVLLCDSETILPDHVILEDAATVSPSTQSQPPPPPDDDLSLATAVRRHIEYVLNLCGGNKSKTARILGITRTTLDKKLNS
ncbi:MAG: sigma-54-dependent Fis family transcriptional regulator, partial [Lentisphaerae bacterium]